MNRLGVLAEREFRLLFLGRGVSQLGSGMAPIALAFAGSACRYTPRCVEVAAAIAAGSAVAVNVASVVTVSTGCGATGCE